MVNSQYCQFEFDSFLRREHALGRNDLVFPILYLPVAALANETKWRNHPVLSPIATRQYIGWQNFRYVDVPTPAMREEIARFCRKIVEALDQPWIAPEDRRRKEEADAEAQAEAEHRKQEAETKWRAEAEARRKQDEAETLRLAEERISARSHISRTSLYSPVSQASIMEILRCGAFQPAQTNVARRKPRIRRCRPLSYAVRVWTVVTGVRM